MLTSSRNINYKKNTISHLQSSVKKKKLENHIVKNKLLTDREARSMNREIAAVRDRRRIDAVIESASNIGAR